MHWICGIIKQKRYVGLAVQRQNLNLLFDKEIEKNVFLLFLEEKKFSRFDILF